MNLQEAKDAKRALQSSIALALRQFSEDTGLTVDSINISSTLVNQMGSGFYCAYSVQVEVKL